MKFLCTILALMVLVLSVQPVCASLVPNNTCCGSQLCEDEQEENNDLERDCKTGCNPFQVCGCCAFSIVLPGTLSFIVQIDAQHSIVQWGVSSFGLSDKPALGFWQPPKIAA